MRFFITLIVLSGLSFSALGAASPELRLNLAKARLLLNQGNAEEVLSLLDSLSSKSENEAEYHYVRAQAERQIGRNRRAYEHSKRAIALNPTNEDIQRQHHEISKSHRSFISTGYPLRFSKNSATERISYIHGEYRINDYTAVGTVLERNEIDVKSMIRAATGVTENVDKVKGRVRAYLSHDYENGDRAVLHLYGGDNIVGIGGDYRFWDLRGHTGVRAAYQSPEWRFDESVVENGTRDYLEIYRQHRFMPRLIGNAAVSANRYGIDGADNVATSLRILASLNYNLHPSNRLVQMLGDDSYVSLGYNLDAEYKNTVKRRLIGAVSFLPLPLSTSEVHTASISAGKRINRFLRLAGDIGYSYDRFGADGFVANAQVILSPVEPLDITFHVGRSIGSEASRTTIEERAGVTATWHF